MTNYSEEEWRMEFQPSSTEFEVGNSVHEKLLSTTSDNLIWTEWWDFDADSPFLTNGYRTSADPVSGIQGWYLCDKPWYGNSGEHLVAMESDL